MLQDDGDAPIPTPDFWQENRLQVARYLYLRRLRQARQMLDLASGSGSQ